MDLIRSAGLLGCECEVRVRNVRGAIDDVEGRRERRLRGCEDGDVVSVHDRERGAIAAM